MHFGAVLSSTLYLFSLSFILAGMEVESEGSHGWAYNMPTWYRTRGFAARAFGLLLGGKPLTGYHVFVFLLGIAIFHAGFIMGAPWSPAAEAMAFAKYFAVCVIWDFLWFILNPAFGLRNFNKEKVWWHRKSTWVLGLFPIDYLVGWLVSAGLATATSVATGDTSIYIDHLWTLAGLLVLTWTTMALSHLYQGWRIAMGRRDDRDDVQR